MAIVIMFLMTLWSIAFLIWLFEKSLPPGDEVHRPPTVEPVSYEHLRRVDTTSNESLSNLILPLFAILLWLTSALN